MIPFNKPYITEKETYYINDAVKSGHISGNGKYTKMCQAFFEERWGFKKTLLTTSCTDALEMCALLLDIKQGDEVILPSFTFVSTGLAFVRQGAKLVFADSREDHPGVDENHIENLITSRTKVIVVVHYAGVACDMTKIMALADKFHLYVVEDAAQAIDSYYNESSEMQKPLGSIGHLATFSFHETKNIQCGEGGLLAINDKNLESRAEIIWEKGTNRANFFRGEVDKYNWVDIGSSFLPSEITAAFLWAQLEEIERIQKKRLNIWNQYLYGISKIISKNTIKLPTIPPYASNNAHMFYIICESFQQRQEIISKLKDNGILAVFHYLGLHNSPYQKSLNYNQHLFQAERYADCLLRLPLFYELDNQTITRVISNIT